MVSTNVPTGDLELITGLYRLTNSIVRQLDQRLGREHNVTFIQAVTLLALDSFERPQPHLVADYLSQQSQTVTGVLDRLERAGHIARRRDLDDRRAVRLELTPSGERLVTGIRQSLRDHIDDVLGNSTRQGRDMLSGALRALEPALPDAV